MPDRPTSTSCLPQTLGEVARLVNGVVSPPSAGTLAIAGAAVSASSSCASSPSLFVAVTGHSVDGHHFLADARQHGAIAAVVTETGDVSDGFPRVVVDDTRVALSRLAAVAAGEPARALRSIAVTGTNGKTTTAVLSARLLTLLGTPSVSIGTLGAIGVDGFSKAGSLTTPDPVTLHRWLREAADSGHRGFSMEVSSIALDQRRADDVPFEVGIFTNLSRDHLDYHQTMERYLAAKLAMFARMREWRGPDCCAVLNLDDAAIQAAFDRGAFTGMRVVTCGRGEGCDLLLRECTPSDGGMRLRFDALGEPFDLQLPYLGEYNGYNLLGISAAAMALGFPLDAVATKLSQLGQVPGRLQRILHEGIGAYVDYAHSPDSLARALAAVRVGCQGRLIAVFGCGGERDRGKRPLMGRVAVEGADIVIITSDNPRGEPARAILDDILEGIGGAPCVVIEDRRAAIRHAVQLASRDDAILVAGKGHEEYQIIGRETRRFSDVDEVRDAFRLRSEGR